MSFYKSISIGRLTLDGNIFLAPVAGYSTASFRSICASRGASFAFTELVSSEALVRSSNKTEELLRKGRYEKHYAVQLFGGNPSIMADAAKIVLERYHPDCIDINFGCPMPKITRSCGGAFLMQDVPRLFSVVSAVVKAAGSIPVTVKLRSGWDAHTQNWEGCAQACVDAGVCAISMHPRTRAQRYSGKADWSIIGQLVEKFGRYVPICGSGDLFTPEDALRMFEETKCQAIMFARGAMGNPFIFEQTRELLTKGTYTKEISPCLRLQVALDELSEMIHVVGEKTACLQMRKKMAAATKGLPDASSLRARLVACETFEQYNTVIADALQLLK
ncbi:MAG: tRNA dihydrouridine synthase DusB [Spirochaetaceae bacterium]|nr:tRNA dihydrouridine synthase DusB [Spirochaetaceae bacterium]